MVWDLYDGVRSGIADYTGQPHYFNCLFDEGVNDFSDDFELTPIDRELLVLAQEQWDIYRAWELEFHSGRVDKDTHPGNRGVNGRYDELEDLIKRRLKLLHPVATAQGNFSAKEVQPELPDGCLREMEVEWS